MRIRLRAPGDESDAPALVPTPLSRPASAQASPRTPSRMPQAVDVRSPDFIEQRLENLKRKQNWLTYLDQYVASHPEDDDDENGDARSAAAQGADDAENDEEEDDAAEESDAGAGPGFVKSLVCALGVVALTPVWAVTFPFFREKGAEFWPLGSPSLWELYKQSLFLLAFVVLGVELLYYVIAKELPEWGRETWYVLQVELEDMFDATSSCRAAVSRGNEVLIRELCAPIVIDVAVLQLTAWAMFKTHRRWGRVVLLSLAGMIFFDVPGKMNMALQPLPVITSIDQPYALLDEEILVAFNGKNLQPGGTIAWASYWGCASTSPVATCDLQFPATFDKGYAAVTFTSIDHFIPCYRDPPNPLKAEEFECFENIRLPVKDRQSIPGWSRALPGAAPAKKKPSGMPEAETDATADHERSEELAYARRLAKENERVKGAAPVKGNDQKRKSNRSKKKGHKRTTSMSVDASTGEAKTER